MKLPRRTNPEREAMLARLDELYAQNAGTYAGQVVRDTYIFYALVGKDRKKLGLEWAERAAEAVEEAKAFDRFVRGMAGV